MHHILFFLALTLLSDNAFADVYKCKDSVGKITFSDQPCPAGSNPETRNNQNQETKMRTDGADTSKKPAYTKDLPSIKAPDQATQACFDRANTTRNFPDPDTTRLLSSTKKWVSVKDVGARQMIEIEVTSKNENGMYVGTHRERCLMMGDGKTINTKPYELL